MPESYNFPLRTTIQPVEDLPLANFGSGIDGNNDDDDDDDDDDTCRVLTE